MTVSQEVWDLTDQELVVAACLIKDRSDALSLPLSNWESQFVVGVRDGYRTYGLISWKQRKHLRAIVDKARKLLKHRMDFDTTLKQAMGEAR